MIWRIIDVIAENDIVTQVKYSVTNKAITTEGYWTFADKTRKLIDQISEKDVVAWIKAESVKNDVCIIEANLENQLNNIQNVVKKPWVVPTFTIKI